MRFDTSQHMKLGQHMKLAPRMIQSMEILQMPLTELQERIDQELENNATLELAEPNAEAEAVEGQPPPIEQYDYMSRKPAKTGERDAKMDAMAAAPARAASLADQLRAQWGLVDVRPEIRADGDLILNFIEDDGYLRTPLDVIADRAPSTTGADGGKPTIERLERALSALQILLEPPGVAARDPRECLLIQLDALEEEWPEELDNDVASRQAVMDAHVLVEHHLDDILQNRLPRIAEKASIPMERVKEALHVMRRLSLAPGRRLVDDPAPTIVPDAIVEYDVDADRYIAYLNDSRIPNLRVNQEYAMMSRDRTVDKKAREFLKTNLGNANWLIDAVNQRKHTLLRVVQAVVAAQREYFDYGPQALKPLPMTQVADQLGIHVATVSRAVAEKYIQTPRGVVPLRRFFTGGTQTDSGEDMSWDAVKAAMKDVVDAEDKSAPLSDEAIAEALKARGVEIARRTVAKYREQLGIPPARLRKTF